MTDKHPPEPWVVKEYLSHYPVIEDSTGAAIVDVDGTYDDAWLEAKPETLRRIVACVNACKGHPTELLERTVSMTVTAKPVDPRPLADGEVWLAEGAPLAEYERDTRIGRDCQSCKWWVQEGRGSWKGQCTQPRNGRLKMTEKEKDEIALAFWEVLIEGHMVGCRALERGRHPADINRIPKPGSTT